MTATNHALTGALIGLTVHNPWVALPVAFLSHFICDMIPHFGPSRTWLTSRAFRYYLTIDALLCMLLVAFLFASGNPNWLLASFCAFLATSPDLLWIRKFIIGNRGKMFIASPLESLLAKIQWFEKPSGAFVEFAWLAGAITILIPLVYNV
jgi:hypothetical protein